jgi:hypothetical protein
VLFLLYICIGCGYVAASVYALTLKVFARGVRVCVCVCVCVRRASIHAEQAAFTTSGANAVMLLTAVLTCVLVPFSAYHYYLVFTNQTTLEHAINCADWTNNRRTRGCLHNTELVCGDT